MKDKILTLLYILYHYLRRSASPPNTVSWNALCFEALVSDQIMEEHDTQQLINHIRNPETESHALAELVSHEHSSSFEESHFFSVVDVVLLPSTPPLTRRSLLEKTLVPPQGVILPRSLFNKLLAVIGPPEVYIRSGKMCKLKRLPSACQSAILDWFLETIPFYGFGIFRSIQLAYPILFSLLTHQYCRRHITSLIVIGTLNQDDARIPFKDWQTDILNALMNSCPKDPSLSYLKSIILRTCGTQGTVNSANLRLPSKEEYLRSIVEIKGKFTEKFSNMLNDSQSDIDKETSAVWEAIEKHQKSLLLQASSHKRIKLSSPCSNGEVLHKAVSLSIPKIPLIDVARNISSLEKPDPTLIFNAKLRDYKSNLIRLVLSYVNCHNCSIKEESRRFQALFETADCLDSFVLDSIQISANYGIFLTSKVNLISNHSFKESTNKQLARIKLLIISIPHTKEEISSVVALTILTFKELITKKNVLSTFFTNVALYYGKVVKLKNDSDNWLSFEAFPSIYLFVTHNWALMSLRCQLSFTRLLRSVMNLLSNEVKFSDKLVRLIPPPQLAYQLLLSTNPLIVTEILGLISSLKSLKCEERLVSQKKLINSLVYDCVNFMWKDLAFKHESKSFNKGMYLNPDFVDCMGRLNFFGSSDFLSLKTVGSISRNPAFAYMCAEIVWSLEDSQEDISIRHPGPLSEESVFRVQKDPDVSWVRMSYKDIKNNMLHQLVDFGFKGLGDFLYSSIRSLRSKRCKSISQT